MSDKIGPASRTKSKNGGRKHQHATVKVPDSGYLIAPHGGSYVEAFSVGRRALADANLLAKARRAAEALANKEHIAVDIIRVGSRGEDRFIAEQIYPREWGQEPYRGQHYATKKKSPAQLQREIDEALAKPAHYRSAVSGRYVQKDSARRRPRTTIKESHATQRQPKLDGFTDAYLEAALWSSTDDEGTPLDRNYSISDFAPEALAAAIKVSKEFQKHHEDDLNETSADDEQHGHDFWLTRNGHGAGFWDRGYGPVGDRLSKAAKAYGSEDIYVGDDGLLYFT